MALKMIQVGTGGHGAYWCREYLPPVISQGLVEVVAAVDIDSHAWVHAMEGLGLREDQCYTDIERAFAEHAYADFCTIVVPPAYHEQVVDLALKHDMHILSEKPISDTLESAIRIVRKVEASHKKMGVTMSHRFDQDKTSLRYYLQKLGSIDYLTCKYSGEYRKFGSARKYRHEMEHPLLIEMAVHHLDILVDLAGDICETVYAETWNPSWGEFKGDSQGFVMMQMRNGVRAMYEGANTNAAGLNDWQHEYIKAECEQATVVLNHRRIEQFRYNGEKTHTVRQEGTGEPLPLLERMNWSNSWLIEQFVDWVQGGAPMETNVADNLQSMALIFAAIESSKRRTPIQVQPFLEDAIQRVALEMNDSSSAFNS